MKDEKQEAKDEKNYELQIGNYEMQAEGKKRMGKENAGTQEKLLLDK